MVKDREEDFTWVTPASIARNYKDARKRAGLTQRALANSIGVSYKQVSRWENAQAVPSPANYKKLKEILAL